MFSSRTPERTRGSSFSPKRAAALGLALALALPLVPATAAMAAEGHGHVAAQYTLELLQPTGENTSSNALGINDNGDVVGITRGATAQPQWTVLWERHGDHFHAHQLSNLEGSAFSRGFDVNGSGAVVGEAFAGTPRSVCRSGGLPKERPHG